MKKMLRGIALAGTGAALLFVLSACGNLDVVAKESVTSFEKVLDAIPGQVSADEMNGGFSLSAPDGSARFIWSENYAASPLHDVMLELDAQPFLDAGLDAGKLPENYAVAGGKLMVGVKLGDDELAYSGDPTPLAAYGQIVEKYRDAIGFHTSLDHFNVNLGDGNLFEWAKDFQVNAATKEKQDKDIVFVLNPDPLIAAGVDPGAATGWAYAQVTVDVGGKPTEVYKFLKPFDLA
ncbi:MAG: hypothetical protein LBS91_02400 [Clostridiales Family XIII bacterium]|jgi:hypothetical protein|nr:hypothetical protein [Clostridiales Family XIII bacterium]